MALSEVHIDGRPFKNWDCPEVIDNDLLLREIDNKKQQLAQAIQQEHHNHHQQQEQHHNHHNHHHHHKGKLSPVGTVIVEGFVLYHDEKVSDKIDIKFLIVIDKPTCFERRYKVMSGY